MGYKNIFGDTDEATSKKFCSSRGKLQNLYCLPMVSGTFAQKKQEIKTAEGTFDYTQTDLGQ